MPKTRLSKRSIKLFEPNVVTEIYGSCPNGVNDYLQSYYLAKPADCILYSEDGCDVRVHKELFSQTALMREVIKSVTDHCCGPIEIIFQCSHQELCDMKQFLYGGEVCFATELDCYILQSNLNTLCGFPKDLPVTIENETLVIGESMTWDPETDNVFIVKEEMEGQALMFERKLCLQMQFQLDFHPMLLWDISLRLWSSDQSKTCHSLS